jgi:hypothetical protein
MLRLKHAELLAWPSHSCASCHVWQVSQLLNKLRKRSTDAQRSSWHLPTPRWPIRRPPDAAALQVAACIKIVGQLLLASASQQRAKAAFATAQAQDQVQGGLLLDVVVCQSAAVLQLLASKDEALLVRRDALLVLQQSGKAAVGRWLPGMGRF